MLVSGVLLPFTNTLEDPVVIKNIHTHLKVHGTSVPANLLSENRAPTHVGLFNEFQSAIVSLTVALSGMAYNTWRNEKSELNSNVRTADFEILLEIGELQRVVFFSHYDVRNWVIRVRDGYMS